MNHNESISLMPENVGKTTCTFRIMPHEKLKLASKARELGMSPSQYIEALVLNQHNILLKKEEKTNQAVSLTFKEETKIGLFNSFLKKLTKRFPKYTAEEIVLASMVHAYENQGALWQRSMNTFLHRLTKHFYNPK